jgi:hypothetical protein
MYLRRHSHTHLKGIRIQLFRDYAILYEVLIISPCTYQPLSSTFFRNQVIVPLLDSIPTANAENNVLCVGEVLIGFVATKPNAGLSYLNTVVTAVDGAIVPSECADWDSLLCFCGQSRQRPVGVNQ